MDEDPVCVHAPLRVASISLGQYGYPLPGLHLELGSDCPCKHREIVLLPPTSALQDGERDTRELVRILKWLLSGGASAKERPFGERESFRQRFRGVERHGLFQEPEVVDLGNRGW